MLALNVPAAHVVVIGFGIHWPVEVLHTNDCELKPPGNTPLEQDNDCGVFDVVAVKLALAPVTDIAGQPVRNDVKYKTSYIFVNDEK